MPKLTMRDLSEEELDELSVLLGSYEERRAALHELRSRTVGGLMNKVKMDFGWNLAFAKEPDGSFSWVAHANDGAQVKAGVADSWDDALLAAIDGLYPPSAEAPAG
jgi:hypothetical protein